MICKTCGGSNGKHFPSILDHMGAGHPDHAVGDEEINELLENYEDRKKRGRYSLGMKELYDSPADRCRICNEPAPVMILEPNELGKPPVGKPVNEWANMLYIKSGQSYYLCEKHWLAFKRGYEVL